MNSSLEAVLATNAELEQQLLEKHHEADSREAQRRQRIAAHGLVPNVDIPQGKPFLKGELDGQLLAKHKLVNLDAIVDRTVEEELSWTLPRPNEKPPHMHREKTARMLRREVPNLGVSTQSCLN